MGQLKVNKLCHSWPLKYEGWSRNTDSSKDASIFLPSEFTLVHPETLKTLWNIWHQYFSCEIKLVYELPGKDDWPTTDWFYLQAKLVLYLLLPALEYLWLSASRLSLEDNHWKQLFRSLVIFHWTEKSALSGGWDLNLYFPLSNKDSAWAAYSTRQNYFL